MTLQHHAEAAIAVAAALDVDPAVGLTTDEAERRAADHGPNVFEASSREPLWRMLVKA